jgi:hypothetical protein
VQAPSGPVPVTCSVRATGLPRACRGPMRRIEPPTGRTRTERGRIARPGLPLSFAVQNSGRLIKRLDVARRNARSGCDGEPSCSQGTGGPTVCRTGRRGRGRATRPGRPVCWIFGEDLDVPEAAADLPGPPGEKDFRRALDHSLGPVPRNRALVPISRLMRARGIGIAVPRAGGTIPKYLFFVRSV